MATKHVSLLANNANKASFDAPFVSVGIYHTDGDEPVFASVSGALAEVEGDDTHIVMPGERRLIAAPMPYQEVGLVSKGNAVVEVEAIT